MDNQHKTINVDFNLFNNTSHNPSYASLTNNFENINGLKDYCIPANYYFPPPSTMNALSKKIPYALKYYPSSNETIVENIATFSEIQNPNWIVAGNGSTEIISWLNSIFIKDSLFVPVPSFGRWVDEPKGLGVQVYTAQYQDTDNQHLGAEQLVHNVKVSEAKNLVICNPNNPTGSIFSREEILWILSQLTHLDNIIIDESFIDFSDINPPSVKNDVANFANAWVLKSLGKNLGLHGLRIGFAVSNEKNIQKIRKHIPYWNINGVSEMLLSLIKEKQQAYNLSREKVIQDTIYLARQIRVIPEVNVFPVNANFIFFKLCDVIDGIQLRDRLLRNHGCFVRTCANKLGSSKQYFRIASRPPSDVNYLVLALKTEIAVLSVGLR